MQRLLKSSESMTVEKASKKASDAVWKMFHFDKAGLGAVDSVTSFGGGGGTGAALLAVTVMMQSVVNDTAANLWKVAADFADGSWKDSSARAKIADWAFGEDINDEFETVHKNVEKLGLAAVPDFEKYIRTFYLAELGMDACSDENAGKIFFSKNKSSAYYASDLSDVSVTATRFICDEKTKAWREATDKEKDTYGFGAGQDGETRQGLVNAGIVYTYNETSGNWRVVSSRTERDAYFVEKSNITDYVDIQEVYEGLKDDERVIFLLRHGKRGQNATSKEDGLTPQGLDSAKFVGSKLKKFKEPLRLGASEFYRAQKTVIGIAMGRGQDTTVTDTISALNDDWYMIDRQLVNQAEQKEGGWEATSLYAYTGAYSGSRGSKAHRG
jgi:Phosphoglycerate mutase family.